MINIDDLRSEIEQAIEEVVKGYDYDYADFFGDEIDIHTNDNTIITISLDIEESEEE
jgi:hypothetical protein